MQSTLYNKNASLSLYRDIVEHAGEAIIAFDSQGHILIWNLASEQLFGYKQPEALGRSLGEFIHPTEQLQWFKSIKQLASGISPITLELCAVQKGGNPLPIEASLVRTTEPSTPLFIAFMKPIERVARGEKWGIEQKGLHQTKASPLPLLTTRESLVHEIIGDILSKGDAITVLQLALDRLCQFIDADWGVIWPFDESSKYLQSPLHEYIKQDGESSSSIHVLSPIPAEFSQSEVVSVSDLRKVENLSDFEQKLLQGQISSYAHIPIRCPTIFSGVLGIHKKEPDTSMPADIALMKGVADAMVIALRKANFIQDIQESQQELMQYAAKLEKSNKELENFATIASHDLQEPLRKVMLFSDHLQKTEQDTLSPESLDDLRRIQFAVKRMRRLIDDLLDLSRVTRRGQPFQEVDLNGICKEVIAELSYTYPQIKSCIELNGTMHIEADSNQMNQMMAQVLDNAFKFQKPNKSPVIKILIQPQNASHCQVTIEDNGIGMKPEHLNKIFDTFIRLHPGTEYSGTGIGLSLVRKIVERHEGSIIVQSDVNEGSTFIITLPVSQNKPNG